VAGELRGRRQHFTYRPADGDALDLEQPVLAVDTCDDDRDRRAMVVASAMEAFGLV
jgi:hypothetical protein